MCYLMCVVYFIVFFFFNDTATTEIYTYRHTLSLHDALPILNAIRRESPDTTLETLIPDFKGNWENLERVLRSEEHTSELQSLMRISYAVFCLTKKKRTQTTKKQKLSYKSLIHTAKHTNL